MIVASVAVASVEDDEEGAGAPILATPADAPPAKNKQPPPLPPSAADDDKLRQELSELGPKELRLRAKADPMQTNEGGVTPLMAASGVSVSRGAEYTVFYLVICTSRISVRPQASPWVEVPNILCFID